MKVEVEKGEKEQPLTIIYGNSDLALALARVLKKQDLRVTVYDPDVQSLPVLERPTYLFGFLGNQVPIGNAKIILQELYFLARRSGAKLVIVLENIQREVEEKWFQEEVSQGWPAKIIEVRGQMDGPAGEISEQSAAKLVKAAFSSSLTRQVIVGKRLVTENAPVATPPKLRKSVQDIFDQLARYRRQEKKQIVKMLGKMIFWLGVLIVFLPVLVQMLVLGRAGFLLWQATNSLRRGDFAAVQVKSLQAKSDLNFLRSTLRDFSGFLGPLGGVAQKPHDLLLVGESVAEIVYRLGKIGKPMEQLTQSLLSGKQLSSEVNSQILTNLGPIDINLGLLEASLAQATDGITGEILNFLGLSNKGLRRWINRLAVWRQGITQAENFLRVWDRIIPYAGQRVYLLVFQNSTELRPTGGFIGSYGLLKFSSGRLAEWKIYDVYTADNQLRGHVNPPDEILHFLGQPNWYLRDSNWAADWPLSAKRIAWFLEKETGQKTDGVIGVNLGAVQKILQATGPLELPDLNQTVSSTDFFEKAEYHSEINFFAGSTGKKDFLGAVASAILENLTDNSAKNFPAISNAFLQALNEKEILLFFNDPLVQKAAINSGWAGTIELPVCQEAQKNCLMLVEANLGANKANYFLRRSLRIDAVIHKGGEIENTVTVLYQNDSPSEAWPGGGYKNYLRFLIPYGSEVLMMDLGDGRKAKFSTVLTAEELSRLREGEFLAFKSMESGFASLGVLIEVPVGESRTVVFKYRLPIKLSFLNPVNDFVFYFLKQPGTNPDYLDYTVEYPHFLEPQLDLDVEEKPLVFTQKLIYNADNKTDKRFLIKFKNKMR